MDNPPWRFPLDVADATSHLYRFIKWINHTSMISMAYLLQQNAVGGRNSVRRMVRHGRFP
jgi:hypothetical protein